jgi:hypothetical protein
MLKKLFMPVTILSALLLSGCMMKTTIHISKKWAPAENGGKMVSVATHNQEDSHYGFVHTKKNNNAKFLIQADAMVTQWYKMNYFRIVSPFDSSSEMLTSSEELKTRCYTLGVETSIIGQNSCYTEIGPRYENKIIMYKERPTNVLVFDAEEIIQKLKEEEIYVGDDSIKIFITDKLTPY